MLFRSQLCAGKPLLHLGKRSMGAWTRTFTDHADDPVATLQEGSHCCLTDRAAGAQHKYALSHPRTIACLRAGVKMAIVQSSCGGPSMKRPSRQIRSAKLDRPLEGEFSSRIAAEGRPLAGVDPASGQCRDQYLVRDQDHRPLAQGNT